VTTSEVIEHVRDAYRLINERTVKNELLADDFLLEQAPGIPGTRGTFRGAVGMEASMNELLTGFDEFRFDPERFDVHDDWLVVPVRFWATARGFEMQIAITHLWRFRGDKAVRLRVLAGETDPLEEISKLKD
jgi:ketosteroid isomerase-like protein